MNFTEKLTLKTSAFSLKNMVLTTIFVAFAMMGFGQTVLKYVPADADVVVTLNLQNLDKKVNWEQLKQYDFFQAAVKDVLKDPEFEENEGFKDFTEKFMTDPASIGFDTKEPFVFFIENKGFDSYMTFVSKMGNRAAYEAAVEKIKSENIKPCVEVPAGMNVWQRGESFFAWNDEVIIEMKKQAGYDPSTADWSYTDTAVYNEENVEYDTSLAVEEWDSTGPESLENEEALSENTLELLDSLGLPHPGETDTITLDEYNENFDWVQEVDTAAVNYLVKTLNHEFVQPLSRNARFMATKGRTNDVHFWMDYGAFAQKMSSMQQTRLGMATVGGYQQMMSAMSGMFSAFYGNSYISMGLNFEDGRTAVRSQMFFNEDMKRFYSRALDAKFNKKFLRYVKGGDEMFGYFYLNYNIKNTIEETKSLLYKVFDATPQYGEAASDMMQILGIFIDEDAIGNLLKGDLMVAVSGIQTVEVATQTYSYDEDFNYTAKDTTMMKQVPIFTALASYGNGKDIQKFINLGLHSKVLTQEGNFYRLPDMDGMEFFLAKHDGMLIFTNNAYLMRQNLEKGFDKKLRLPKNHKKRLCENGSVVYWNIPNTVKAAAGSQADSNIGMMGYLNNISKEFYSVEMTTSKKVGNSVESEMFLNMTGKETNALQQFFNFVNDMYLEVIGGAKI